MKRLLLFYALFSLEFPVAQAVEDDIHAKCLKAADYEGCAKSHKTNTQTKTMWETPGINLRSNLSPAESFGPDDVEVSYGYTYRRSSVGKMKVRGKYGRYLSFWGRSTNEYQGTPGYYNPGSPGSVDCTTTRFGFQVSTNCNRSGYVAPSYMPGTSGGTQARWFEYELDCLDRTFNRKGDIARGMARKGWMDVYYDPTAREVADRYCPIIDDLTISF